MVLTANPTPLQHEEGWALNGVGRHYSHKFGYGLMDAGAIVDLALRWPGIGKQVIEPLNLNHLFQCILMQCANLNEVLM